MALLSSHIGEKRAIWLGNAHEKKNKEDFEKGRLEDNTWVDEIAIKMDLTNNEFGARIGRFCRNCSDQKLLQTVIEALEHGELKIIKQNVKGEFLDKNNQIILEEKWVGTWQNERELVPSNQ